MQLNRLTTTKIKSIKEPCKLGDGGGLWLVATQNARGLGFKWVYRYRLHGKDRALGLGVYPVTTLTMARDLCMEKRRMVAAGIDPYTEKHKHIATFESCVKSFINTNAVAWKSDKHKSQWENTLTTYAGPEIGEMKVSDIATSHVVRILEPIWSTKTETATRVRQRIEKILDWAAVQGYRSGDNPARWQGHLDHILPAPNKIRKVRHHKAMKWQDVPEFMNWLKDQESMGAKGLHLTILTCLRTGESSAAEWSEFEGDNWTIPEWRMKGGRIHRVPLSRQALELVENLPRIKDSKYLFPGLRKDHICNNTMLKFLKENRPGFTVHGFRSSFRDWVAEATNYPRELAEACLAHILKDKTEAAYQRGDMLERRREVMQAWADYCCNNKGNV